MSEFRKGRKRFISRDPAKTSNRWEKEEYNGSVIATGTNVAATSKNDASSQIHQPTFDLRAADPTNCGQYTGSSTRLSSLKQRSTRPTSPNSRHRSESYSSRPSDDRLGNDVARSRDRSALRPITVDTKTRIGSNRSMASEIGFRPILRRHGSSSSSSSGCESPSLKDNGIVTLASSKTTMCPVTLPHDALPATATTMSSIDASQKTETGAQQGHHTLPGTFLTLPAHADSMQVQIRDTKISITRIPPDQVPPVKDQVPAATARLRTLSAEYDNVPEPAGSSSSAAERITTNHGSISQSVPPAFPPSSSSFESSGQLSPVRGLRLVPSPNSAFTKTKPATTKVVQAQSESYANWTVPALSLRPLRGPLDLERSTKPSDANQSNSLVPEQIPIDFNLIFSGIGLRPLDLEDSIPVPEKPRTFRALKSCSLESIVVDADKVKTPGISNRACANESFEVLATSWLGKSGTNKIDAPPITKTADQSSALISQTSSLDNKSKLKRITTEVEIRPKQNFRLQASTTSKPITDVFTITSSNKQPIRDPIAKASSSLALKALTDPFISKQPIRDYVAKASPSLALKALTDPFTNLSTKYVQPTTNLFTSTVVQPITGSRQPYWAESVGPIISASNLNQPIKSENCFVASCRSNTGLASRPITVSTTSFGKVNVSTYILPPSVVSTTSTAPSSTPPGLMDKMVLAGPTIASAMSSLEKAISMLNSVAMDTSAPGVPMTMLSTIAMDTESLAKSFQLENSPAGTELREQHGKASDSWKLVSQPPHELINIDGNMTLHRTESASEPAASLPGTLEYPVREDAVLTLTLNLLDQTLAEIQQEFPPGKRPSDGRTLKTEVSSSSRVSTSGPAIPASYSDSLSSSKNRWDPCSGSSQAAAHPRNSSTFPEKDRDDSSASRMTAEISESDRYLRRMLDRQDSFNRPGSALFPETLPLPKDSVIQRYRRRKKTRSSASSSSSSSTSSSSAEEGLANGAAGAKRSPRSGRRHTRRHRQVNRSEDGAAAAAGESKTKTRAGHRRRRTEGQSDKEQDKRTYKQAYNQDSTAITYTLGNNLHLFAAGESVPSRQSLVTETWLTLASGPISDVTQIFDSMNPSAKPSQETTTNQSASVDTPLDLLLDARVQPSVTSNMIGTIYTNSVSDPERDGHSAVRRSFRNLGTGVEDDGQWIGTASRISPQGMPRTSASSSRNQPTRSHSSGSCSPADTSSRTKNLTSFSHRRRCFGENRSQTTSIDDEQQRQQQQRQRQHHHHLRSSSDRLSAASADEDVFFSRCRESESPSQKQLSHRSPVEGPQRSGVRSSGAHGCDHRTGSPRLDCDLVQSDSDRGPPRDGSSFTGSVRLTLKQKSEDLPDDGGSQKIRTLSTRTNSSTDEFPGVIRAHSKAVSYESICLRIKEESTESPKSIQVISLSQPASIVSAGYKTVLPQQTVNTSISKISRSPPFSASRSCEVPPAPDVISTRPVQRDHSTKHRSTVFFSSNADPSRSESSNLLPIQMVVNVPAGKLVQQNIGEGNRKSALGQPLKMFELLNENRFEIMALNKECRADVPQASTQTPLKSESEARRKLTVIGEAEGGTKSDERLLKVGPTEQTSSYFDAKANLDPAGKGSKFFIQRDQQPSSNPFVMGTVFTDRRNQPHPGTDFVQRNSSGRTPESKASSESSKSMQQVSSYKIIKQNSRPVVEKSHQAIVVPEDRADVSVRKVKLSADEGSAPTAPIVSKDVGGRIRITQPASAVQDSSKFSSSFLCSLSKFSQPPAESISILSSRPKPLCISSASSTSSFSRVDWAKQRLNQVPESKSSAPAISQLKTSLRGSTLLRIHEPGSVYPQSGNTDVTIAATSRQDGTTWIAGKHTSVGTRRETPSVGDSLMTTAPLSYPVTAIQDLTILPSPLVLGPVNSSELPSELSETFPRASVPLMSKGQIPATSGNLATGSLKVFMQSQLHPAAVLKRTSLRVPYLSAPSSDITNSQFSTSGDFSANSGDNRWQEIQGQHREDKESSGDLLRLNADSTCSAETASPRSLFENSVVKAFVSQPPIADVCVLVQEIVPTAIVEPVIPDDYRVAVFPVDGIACQEPVFQDVTASRISSETSQSRTSPENSFEATLPKEPLVSNRFPVPSSSNSVAIGKHNNFGHASQDPLRVFCPIDEASGGRTIEGDGEPCKAHDMSPSDSLDSMVETEDLLEAIMESEENLFTVEVSSNENDQRQTLSHLLSPDARFQVQGPGLSSKLLEDVHDSTNAFHSENKLSQLDRNPRGFEPSSDVTNRPMAASSHVESTLESTTLTSRQQGPSAQRQPIRDTIQIDPGLEIPASRNPAVTKDDPRGSKSRNESPLVRTRDTNVTCVLSEDHRAMRTVQSVKPEADVTRGRLTKTRSIPSLEISEEDSKTTSPSTVTSSSSSMKSTPEVRLSKTTSSALAKKTQNPIASTPEEPLSSAAGGSNPSQSFAVDTDQNYSSPDEFGETSRQSPSAETATMDPDFGGLGKTAEMEKTRRFVRFESEDELLEFSPKERSASSYFHTPAGVPAGGKPDAPINVAKADAISASLVGMKPAFKRSPEEDSILKFSRNDPVAFTDSLPKAPRKDPDTHEDLRSNIQKKDSEPSIRDDASTKTSPSTGRAMSKPGIVRKQLVHLDSALHPSSCVPTGESKPVEARWSPKLVRKLNLAEAKDVDVSDLDVAPDLLDFLSRQMEMEMASVDAKQPATLCEATCDGFQQDTGRTQEIPAALSAQRKPPLALPLKPTEREEDAPPPSTSAADNDDVKPEAEVGKRKFFSALKANAQSFRAKKTSGVDDPSPDKSHLDRLASFALISDVGIGSKRRQFQQHKEASLSSVSTSCTDPTADAQAKRPSAESPPSTNRAPMKNASHSGTNDDKTKTRLGRVDESETRLGTESEPLKARLGGDERRAETRQTRPEVDSDDDDFDRLVEINFRQLVDERNRTSSMSQADGPTSMELLKGDRTHTGTGSAGVIRGQQKVTQGVRRQMSRFKTQPVTTVEVEKARELNLLHNKSEN